MYANLLNIVQCDFKEVSKILPKLLKGKYNETWIYIKKIKRTELNKKKKNIKYISWYKSHSLHSKPSKRPGVFQLVNIIICSYRREIFLPCIRETLKQIYIYIDILNMYHLHNTFQLTTWVVFFHNFFKGHAKYVLFLFCLWKLFLFHFYFHLKILCWNMREVCLFKEWL